MGQTFSISSKKPHVEAPHKTDFRGLTVLNTQEFQTKRLEIMRSCEAKQYCLLDMNITILRTLHHVNPKAFNLYVSAFTSLTSLGPTEDEVRYRNFFYNCYVRAYRDLSARQKENVSMFNNLTVEQIFMERDRILDELASSHKVQKSGSFVRRTLSGDYFKDFELDFAGHLLSFKHEFDTKEESNRDELPDSYLRYLSFRRTINKAHKEHSIKLTVRNSPFLIIPPEIGRLDQLVELNLTSNGFTHLPHEIGQLTNLQTLRLYSNNIAFLPLEIGQLYQLGELDLRSNKLASLPAQIGQLTNLAHLDLSYNKFTNTPPEIVRLFNLRKLRLRHNTLTSFSAILLEFPHLETLNLEGNKITSLPTGIKKLSRLTYLNLDHNKLATLPPEIGQLPQLLTLSLSENQLIALPAEIGELAQLTKLSLSYNKLRAIPPEICQLLKLQSDLNLCYNKLRSLPIEILKMHNLRHVDLRGNNVRFSSAFKQEQYKDLHKRREEKCGALYFVY